jgi:Putative DNA-binding domain
MEDQIQALVEAPSERLHIEVKPWLDPSSNWGEGIIAKALLALRNQDGGFLLIGFDDDGSPGSRKKGLNIKSAFHIDNIQQIASRYASKPFQLHIHFRSRAGVEYPIIQVESGIKTPVFCKAELKNDKGEKVLSFGDIYVRTLSTNGVVSTSKIQKNEDFEDLLQRCFENREADHAAFLSKLIRSTSKSDIEKLLSFVSESHQATAIQPGSLELKILDYGRSRLEAQAGEREVDLSGIAFLEGALRIEGPLKKYSASREFLQLIHSANPSLTGWPIWLISQSFSDVKTHPYPYHGAWEQFIQAPGFSRYHLDFMMFSPKGEFYFARALEDDTGEKKADPEAPKTVEPIIQLLRVAEALAVGKAIASVLGDPPEELKLFFAFRWTGLKNRHLVAWSNLNFEPVLIGICTLLLLAGLRLPRPSGEDMG